MQSTGNILGGDFVTGGEEETLALGEQLGQLLGAQGVPRALILQGPLGAGKTCFIRGLVKGLGAADAVSSPSFALVHEYTTGKIPLAHLDFYRLKNEAEVLALGWEDLLTECVVAAEWGDRFPNLFPPGSIHLTFEELAGGSRQISICPEPYAGPK
jgi:tRNA threonylcarbamoyladenosine biosynthesis protein TsaE